MKDSLYELIDRKYLKEIRYDPVERVLLIDIQEKDVTIRFFDTDNHCILINAKMDNKQNEEIYNIVKNELINIHNYYYYRDYTEVIEDKKNDKNIHSVFAFGIKKDLQREAVRKIQKEFMGYILDIVTDFNYDISQQILNTIKENKDLFVIVHGEGEKEYEIFI